MSEPSPLLEALLAEGRGTSASPSAPMLAEAVRSARSAWPGVELPDELFVPYLAARLPEADPDTALAELAVADLYLACACVLGVPEALRSFEHHVMTAVEHKMRRMLGADEDRDEILQRVRTRMLVPKDGTPPKLSTYAGKGSLTAWAKVVTVRDVLMTRRRTKPELPEDDALEHAGGLDLDPELELMRQRYREAFRSAFSEALSALGPEDRNVLRLHVIDRLGIDRIGALLGIHRSTAARKLVRARADLRDGILRRLQHDLSIPAQEVESIIRLVRSQLEVSLRALL